MNKLSRTFELVLFAALALATLVPLWSDAGWPMSHEGYAFAHRTYVYARHFSWLDFLPIWSSIDASGFGSPMPLLYHKLFYLPAAALTLATGSLKAADGITVAAFLVVGAIGMSRTLRLLGASPLASAIGGCCLITANYTVINWLVRGALAEFCAAMIVPWVFLALVKTIQSARLPIAFGVTLALLWLSHSVLAYYTGLLVTIAYGISAALGMAPWRALRPSTIWRPALVFGGIVALWLVPIAIVGADYDFSRIVTRPYHPIYQFRPFHAYFWETRWQFGATAVGLTTQLDHAMVLLLAVSLGAVALPGMRPASRSRRDVLAAVAPFLVLLVGGLVLQLPWSAPFYGWLPGAAFIQFPWRLLAIVTPALIIAAIYLADQLLPPAGRQFLLGGAFMSMVLGCGAFVSLRDARIQLAAPGGGVTFSGFREYEPRVAAPVGQLQNGIAARWADAGCEYTRLDHNEVRTVRFATSCRTATVLPLPIYATPMHSVRTPDRGRGEPCLPVEELPGVCGAVVPASTGMVSVDLPTLWAFGRSTWRSLSSRAFP